MDNERDVRAWVRDETERIIESNKNKREWSDDAVASIFICLAIIAFFSLFPLYWITHESAPEECAAACKQQGMAKWSERVTDSQNKLITPELCECKQ